MQLKRIFLLLSFLSFALAVLSQTDTVGRDSVAENSSIRKNDVRRDTAANLRSATRTNSEPVVVKDSARLALERLPRQAVLSSAIIPGWGQIRNGRWWKVPIIYGGFVGLVLTIDWEQRHYKETLGEIKHYQDSGFFKSERYRAVPGLTDQSLVRWKDYYRRNRDLSILGIGALYAIQLIDAYVDAKFFRFDVGDDLTLKVQPTLQPSLTHAFAPPNVGFKVKLSL